MSEDVFKIIIGIVIFIISVRFNKNNNKNKNDTTIDKEKDRSTFSNDNSLLKENIDDEKVNHHNKAEEIVDDISKDRVENNSLDVENSLENNIELSSTNSEIIINSERAEELTDSNEQESMDAYSKEKQSIKSNFVLSKNALQSAVIYKEILDKPLSLRD